MPNVNLHVPDDEYRILKRFMRRLKIQHRSLSRWFCEAFRSEEERAAAVDKMLENKEQS